MMSGGAGKELADPGGRFVTLCGGPVPSSARSSCPTAKWPEVGTMLMRQLEKGQSVLKV